MASLRDLVQGLLPSRRGALKQARAAIEDLRRAEAASRRDAGLLTAILDSIGDGVGVVDSQGQFILHNAAAKAMLGVGDDVEGPEPWQEHYGMFRLDGSTPFPEQEMPLVRALAGESTDLVDMVIRNPARPEGVTISVTGRPIDLAAFGLTGRGAVAVFHDITERQRLDAQLRLQHDRHERLLGILSDLGEGVLVRDDLAISYVNDAYTELTGYSLQELLALPDTAVLAADEQSAAQFVALGRQLNTGSKSAVHLTRIRHKDGHVVPVEVAGMHLHDESTGTSERVYVVRDLTQARRAEVELAERAGALQRANEQLHEARAAAEAASEAKSRFLTTMSHEIRTPLNGVLGFTALLAESPGHPDAGEWAGTADAAGRALLDIVNNGLDLAKIEAGGVELESIELNLLDIAAQALLPSRLVAQQAGVDLRLVIDDGLGADRWGDPLRLRQIMTNLVSNAVKFTPSGSVTLGLDGQGDLLRIRVVDTGIGMNPEQQERLFIPFQQAATDITRRYGGTGLGLSIAAGLVHAMGGTISLTSCPGEGTTFTVELQLPRATERVRQVPAGDPGPADHSVLSHLRVLVAEDNHTNQLVARAMFTKRGMRVDIVEDGAQAVTAALSGDYDAVFMDCQMPVMGGIEATRRIRADPGGQLIPIIAMTANTYDDERQACLDAGMSDFLPKPWTAQQLTDVLTRLTQQQQLRPTHPTR